MAGYTLYPKNTECASDKVITSTNECQQVFNQLKIYKGETDNLVIEENLNAPRGCYFKYGTEYKGEVKMNRHATGKPAEKARPICKKRVG